MTGHAPEGWPWIEPLEVAAGLRDRDGLMCLLSDGGPAGRHSFVACEPCDVRVQPVAPEGLGDAFHFPADCHGLGLISYDWGARPATGPRPPVWPDLMTSAYRTVLRFDHVERKVHAVGDPAVARGWLERARTPGASGGPAETFDSAEADDGYRSAVAEVVARIGEGELFQANIAREWTGKLTDDADPFDLFVRLASGPAPYGAFWRLGDRALVSNSPELFLAFDPQTRRIETRPIKGTRRRRPGSDDDAASALELSASPKDRAENLMIVDLMRNDLARVSLTGSVAVDRLFALESYATVHHLVSTITAHARPDVDLGDILAATFPPGSITGAPKHQAMKVIARHEPPRGAWCGSLVHVEPSGKATASVLIRTVALWLEGGRWRFRTQAGAGITAGSDPEAEFDETEAKIAAIRGALTG